MKIMDEGQNTAQFIHASNKRNIWEFTIQILLNSLSIIKIAFRISTIHQNSLHYQFL